VPRPPLFARRQIAPLGAGLGLAMATGAAAEPPAFTVDPDQPPSETAGVPVPPGQIDHAIAQLDGLTTTLMGRSGVPGVAVAVVRDGKPVFAKGFGLRRVGDSAPVDADTVFQLASVSKSLSATVVARQIGLGGIAWTTPIIRHLPWFALQDPWVTEHVTLGDLFAHRSGLPDHAGDDLEDLGYDRRQVLERLRLLPLHAFRSTYAYTNFGLTAAAEAVAVAAGTDWASLSQTAIYTPLGMASTSSRFADFQRRPNHAVNHVKIGDRFEPKYQRQPDAQSPAGGASSSVNDMARWMALVLQEGAYGGAPIVKTDALLPAATGQMITDAKGGMAARPSLYGFGFGVGTQPSGRVALSHSGAFALGAATTYMLIPSLGLGIIVLSNAMPVGMVEAVSASFADLVQFGTVTRDWLSAYGHLMAGMMAPLGALSGQSPPPNPRPPAALQQYTGVFGNDYYGPATIQLRSGGLVLSLGPAGTSYPLRHWDGPVFVYAPSGENAPDGSVSAVTFTMAPSGAATAFTNEFYGESGLNSFVRTKS
jgi:CubicO group peptidase (beta-lactamase class C family)